MSLKYDDEFECGEVVEIERVVKSIEEVIREKTDKCFKPFAKKLSKKATKYILEEIEKLSDDEFTIFMEKIDDRLNSIVKSIDIERLIKNSFSSNEGGIVKEKQIIQSQNAFSKKVSNENNDNVPISNIIENLTGGSSNSTITV